MKGLGSVPSRQRCRTQDTTRVRTVRSSEKKDAVSGVEPVRFADAPRGQGQAVRDLVPGCPTHQAFAWRLTGKFLRRGSRRRNSGRIGDR